MSKILYDKYKLLTRLDMPSLLQASRRSEESDKKVRDIEETLGETVRRQLLAHANLGTLEELLESTEVLANTKRCAVLKIGDIYAFANKFGVITYNLPIPGMGKLDWMGLHSVICSVAEEILDRIGAFYDKRDRSGDRLYNYSKCQVTTYIDTVLDQLKERAEATEATEAKFLENPMGDTLSSPDLKQ
jgi:hypothetical protein